MKNAASSAPTMIKAIFDLVLIFIPYLRRMKLTLYGLLSFDF